nr:hypothetical protein [Tanacetum cinerariifolium]
NQSNPSAGFQDKFDAEKAGEESDQQYMLFHVWSSGSTNPYNTNGDAAFDEKEPEFDEKKPESEVNVSLSSSAQSKKQDDKTNRGAKGKSPVDTLVPTVGQISSNSTNTFSAAGNTFSAVELEDITYSNDEDNVGAEADFNNLETSITVSPILTTRVHKDHLVTQIIGDLSLATQTRSMTRVAKDQEPKRVHQALKDPSWIEAMQEELLQFKMQKNERGIVVRNKARLVAQGHTQDEGINYEEVFAPAARIEAIRLFLAYAFFLGFMVYQMDVKSAFLYGTIKEEVHVYQPLGFEDPDHHDKVYKVVKAVYGLHQAPRAWYETLANHLLENGFKRGKIDQTLFIKRHKGDTLLVQIYVDDIIFGSTNKDLCKSFEKLMKDKFHRSSMGELAFFLDGKSASTPIDTEKPLLKDPDGDDVDVHTYRSMIGSLMYLTSSRSDIMFAVCACAHFQVTPKASHLHTVKRIFRYLKGKPHLGLWYLKDSPFDLVAYSDSDYAGLLYTSAMDSESTAGLWFWTYVAVKKVNDITRLQALVDKKKVVVTKATIRDALRLDDAEGVECKGFSGVKTQLFEGMLVAQEVEQGDADENVEDVNAGDAVEGDVIQPTPPQSPQVQPQSPQPQPQQDAEIPMNLLQEVIDTFIALTKRVEHLKLDKIAQALEITKLKRRVKKLERRNKMKVLKLRRLQKVGTAQRIDTSDDTVMDDVSNQERMIADMEADADVVLEEAKKVADNAKDDQDADVQVNADIKGRTTESQAKIYKIDMDHANTVLSMQEEESEPVELQEVVDIVTTTKIITEVVTAASTTITTVDVPVLAATTVAAPTLTAAPKRRTKGVVIKDPEESTTTTSIIVYSESKSKDKVIDHVNKKAKEDPAVKRYQALKRKPQTEAQVRKNMTIYLKNVDGFKMDYFKEMYYDDICPIFEAKFDSNVAFLQKTNEQIDEEDSRALKRINETLAEKAAKGKSWMRRSVYGLAKVKGWKLLESYGVQIITFTTIQLILLLERKYPLTRFTLDQMLNVVRLEVEEESEVSLKLLRFIQQQHQEGAQLE